MFRESGLTATQAIKLCWKQVEIEGALPFAVRVPNDVTIAPDVAEAPLEPLSGAGVGAPAGVSASVSQGADVEESCVGSSSVGGQLSGSNMALHL